VSNDYGNGGNNKTVEEMTTTDPNKWGQSLGIDYIEEAHRLNKGGIVVVSGE
jgi:hypothetical protein